MALQKSQSTLEKLRLKKPSSRPTSKAISEADTAVATVVSGGSDVEDYSLIIANKQLSNVSEPLVATEPARHESMKSHSNTIKTTNSSPTDPSYVPNSSATGGHFAHGVLPIKAVPKSPTLPVGAGETSFFEFDTESEDEEPVVGRASSVRMSKPNVVEQKSISQGQSGRMLNAGSDKKQRLASSMSTRISETSELIVDESENKVQKTQGGPTEALRILNGENIDQSLSTQSQLIADSQPIDSLARLSENAKRGGLCMNPVTEKDQNSVQRAISAPPLPLRSSSNKKVKIRPSDLIVSHTGEDSRLFRESIVTTPYPLFDERDEKVAEDEADEAEEFTALPTSSYTIKSTRFENDKFPSPDRPEALFLTLGLANHPSATTTLEIKIVDKSTYDDEMLFRQIRRAYQGRLLGTSRFAFQLIRRVSYVTVTSSVQYDFDWKEFMRHLDDPRTGRRRKRWIIWLRHHSHQHHPTQSEQPGTVKRPVSASLRTADKRPSEQSDSTSILNFSFLPPLSLPRMPFFNKEARTTASASSLTVMLEGGSNTIKIELHHEFSIRVLAFLSLCIMSSSVAAVVLWTVFGVPGPRPGGTSQMTPGAALSNRIAWSAAAQARVLTGLVLGMMVAMLGSMIELSLVAGAYMLL